VKPVSGKRMCKALERKGWTHARTRSSHFIYVSPDGQTTVSVPVHGNQDLKPGTQKGIMRDAGLADADL